MLEEDFGLPTDQVKRHETIDKSNLNRSEPQKLKHGRIKKYNGDVTDKDLNAWRLSASMCRKMNLKAKRAVLSVEKCFTEPREENNTNDLNALTKSNNALSLSPDKKFSTSETALPSSSVASSHGPSDEAPASEGNTTSDNEKESLGHPVVSTTKGTDLTQGTTTKLQNSVKKRGVPFPGDVTYNKFTIMTENTTTYVAGLKTISPLYLNPGPVCPSASKHMYCIMKQPLPIACPTCWSFQRL